MTAPTPEEIAAAAAVEAEEAEAARLAAEAAASGTDDEGAQALGDKGKQALDRMKADRNAARAELEGYKKLGLAPDKLAEIISQSQEATAAAEAERAKREAKDEALSKANERILRSEIKAAAAGKLANPALALRLLDLSEFDVSDDGDVDEASITSAIEALVKENPGLAAQGGSGTRFGTADGGARNGNAPTQVTEQQLKSMTPEQIVQARKDGRLARLMG